MNLLKRMDTNNKQEILSEEEEFNILVKENKIYQTKELTFITIVLGMLILCLYQLNPPELNENNWSAKEYIIYFTLNYFFWLITIWR